jgi:hypothetical protein
MQPPISDKTIAKMIALLDELGVDLSDVNKEALQFWEAIADKELGTSSQLNMQQATQRNNYQFSEDDILFIIEVIQIQSGELLHAGEIDQGSYEKAQAIVADINEQMYGSEDREANSINAGPVTLNISGSRIEINSSVGERWQYNKPADRLPELVNEISSTLSEAIILANDSNDVLGNLAKAQLLAVLEQAKKEISDPYVDTAKWEDRKSFLAGIRMAVHKVKTSGVALSESTTKLMKAINGLIKQIDTFLGWFS